MLMKIRWLVGGLAVAMALSLPTVTHGSTHNWVDHGNGTDEITLKSLAVAGSNTWASITSHGTSVLAEEAHWLSDGSTAIQQWTTLSMHNETWKQSADWTSDSSQDADMSGIHPTAWTDPGTTTETGEMTWWHSQGALTGTSDTRTIISTQPSHDSGMGGP